MAAQECTCSTPIQNMGQPNCFETLQRAVKLCFMERVANDGTENKVLSTDTLDASFFSGLINQTDRSKAWFPTGVINNVRDLRDPNITFAVEDYELDIDKGKRMFEGTFYEGASPELAAALNSLACRDVAFYTISVTGQLIGNGSTATELKPFRVKKGTLSAIYNYPNKVDNTPASVVFRFAYSELERDEDIAFIAASDISTDLTDLSGLVDVTIGAASGISTTAFTTNITYIYGSHFSKEAWKGGVLADFSLYNNTSASSVTITSVTESADGVYDFVIPVQTSADNLTLTLSKTGYEIDTMSYDIP